MKKIITLIIIFLIYTILIKTCPVITSWDESVIIYVQSLLKDLPLIIPLLPDCILYSIMIFVPIIVSFGWSIYKKDIEPALCMVIIPVFAYLCKFILKPLVHRPRPPMDLQIAVYPHSFSYVSTHSLITFCIWGLVICFLHKYCRNKYLKIAGITFSALWIIFVGLSRVWLGVHFPTDVIGAYLLGFIFLAIYFKIRL